MKNVKTTISLTLTALTLAFSGSVFADNGARQNHNAKPAKATSYKVSQKAPLQNYRQVKRVEEKRMTPVKKIIVTKAPVKPVFVKKAPLMKTSNKPFVKAGKWNNLPKVIHSPKVFYSPKARVSHPLRIYSVRTGDTLYRISLKTGVSIEMLSRLNHLRGSDVNYLRIGQVLRLG